MSDEPENIELAEDKPRRKYVRKTFTGNDKWDDAINAEVEAAAHDVIDEVDIDIIDPEDNVEVEDIESSPPVTTIYREPKTDSLVARAKKKLGFGGRMEPIKPWKGHARWRCNMCNWETFSEAQAKRHLCG